MDAVDRFSRLVLQIQHAALGSASWNDVVKSVVQLSGGNKGILFSPSIPPSHGGFWASNAITPSNMEDYASYYERKDIWRQNLGLRVDRTGTVFRDAAVVAVSEVRRSEFYNDFLRKMNIGRLICGVVFRPTSSVMPTGLHLSVFRSMGSDGFDEEHEQLMRRFMPHLQAGVATYQALGARDDAIERSRATLESLATAALVIGRDCAVEYFNQAAQRLLFMADGLSIRNNFLNVADANANSRLRAFVGSLFQPSEGRHLPRAFRLARLTGKPAFTCFGQPLPSGNRLFDESARRAAILFVRDPVGGPVLEPEILSQLYGFTMAEAQIASALCQGLTLKAAAAGRGICYDTARTQLKDIFAKAGCTRQAELVALLMGTCPI